MAHGDRIVSITVGFSNALRQAELDRPNWCGLAVSIPVGFSNALRRARGLPSRSFCIVSIPVGFSNALRPKIALL